MIIYVMYRKDGELVGEKSSASDPSGAVSDFRETRPGVNPVGVAVAPEEVPLDQILREVSNTIAPFEMVH